MLVLGGVALFLVGAIAGAVALARWWVWRISNPDVAQAILKSVYRRAHPNWLQMSRDDTTRVCPCCGWSEKESLAEGAAKCPGPAPQAANDPLDGTG
jgi:hypothetical protein